MTPINVSTHTVRNMNWIETPSSAKMIQTTMESGRACATVSSCLHAGRGVSEVL